jgi:glycosyltransferase involved in cell wall biosynthesis
METLKFLFTSTFYPPYHVGGDAVHVKYLAEELAKRGHEVHVLHSLDAYKVKSRSLPEKAEVDGVHVHTIETCLNLSPYVAYTFGNSPSILKRFERLLKEIRPDVVHHHNISLLGYGILKKRGDYLNLYTAHDYWLVCQQNNLLKTGSKVCDGGSCFFCALRYKRPPQLWRRMNSFRNAVKDVDVLIAPSNYLKNKVLESFNVKAVTIPNFAPEPPAHIKSSGFSNFFLYAGVLEKHKGVMNLVEVYKEVSDEIDPRLLIVGMGNLQDEIRKLVRRNKLENKIVMLGWVSHDLLYCLLKDANALVMPSIWPENCPLVAVEALSVGTPVISSNKGGLPEIVEKVDKGLVYSSNEELKQLLLNFDKSKYPSHIVKRVYERYFSPQAFLERYFEVISGDTRSGKNSPMYDYHRR